MPIATSKQRAAARRPIETARRETKRAITLARLEGRDGLAAELETVEKGLTKAKQKASQAA